MKYNKVRAHEEECWRKCFIYVFIMLQFPSLSKCSFCVGLLDTYSSSDFCFILSAVSFSLLDVWWPPGSLPGGAPCLQGVWCGVPWPNENLLQTLLIKNIAVAIEKRNGRNSKAHNILKICQLFNFMVQIFHTLWGLVWYPYLCYPFHGLLKGTLEERSDSTV